MANRPSVPKFGTWDSDNVGYTVYFNKVRENKGATAPPLQRPFNPNDPEEEAPRVIAPGSRPATSSGDRAARQQNGHQHRRAGSSTAEKSKFAPPPQYQPRPQPTHHQPPAGHGGDNGNHRPSSGHGSDHGHHHHHRPAGHGSDHGHHHHRPAGHGAHHKPHDARYKPAGARARSASPNHAPGRQRPTAVPKFGAWDEQSGGAQGYTVMFDRVKHDREAARRGGMRNLPRRRMPSPESYTAARRPRHTPFYSKMFGCLIPHTRD
ncbi:hypothetical protein ACQJBY_069630 [Aegilops geniculata]